MEKNQKINCTVNSCIFQDNNNCMCSLKNITVKATPNCNAKTPEESMCGSYKCKN